MANILGILLTTLVHSGSLLSSPVTHHPRLNHTTPIQHGKTFIVRNSTELRYYVNATISSALSSVRQWYFIQTRETTVNLTLKTTTFSTVALFSSLFSTAPACPYTKVTDVDSTRSPRMIEIKQCNIPGTTCLSSTRQPSCTENRIRIPTLKFLGLTSDGARVYQRSSFYATTDCTCDRV